MKKQKYCVQEPLPCNHPCNPGQDDITDISAAHASEHLPHRVVPQKEQRHRE